MNRKMAFNQECIFIQNVHVGLLNLEVHQTVKDYYNLYVISCPTFRCYDKQINHVAIILHFIELTVDRIKTCIK